MARTRHVIVGGGTAGINAITTIRQYDRGASEIILVSAERPYARMVLPYYLKGSISESHVYTLNPTRLHTLDVETYLGRRAVQLDTQANTLTLDDDTVIPYDDLLIATGSSPVRAPVPGADGAGRAQFLDAGTGAGGHSADPSGQLGGHGGCGVYRVYDPQCHSLPRCEALGGGDCPANSAAHDRPPGRSGGGAVAA